jgi:hypothetical protein
MRQMVGSGCSTGLGQMLRMLSRACLRCIKLLLSWPGVTRPSRSALKNITFLRLDSRIKCGHDDQVCFRAKRADSGAALLAGFLALAFLFCGAFPAKADRIQNSVALFAALDKVTGRVSPLEVRIGQTATFGALKVTPRACYTRPATETPLTSAFIEVDELLLDGSIRRIFTGWTFAESPGLHAVEHPTFDIWLTSCKMPVEEKVIGRRPNSPRP